jgi:hypothetical protein
MFPASVSGTRAAFRLTPGLPTREEEPPSIPRSIKDANAPTIAFLLYEPIGLYLNVQVFTASFAKRTKHIDIVALPVFRITKISVGEAVGFADVLHDLLCLCDDVCGGEEPQSPDKRVEPDKF